jgi:hypothetical protein
MSELFEDFNKYPQLTAAQRRWWEQRYAEPVTRLQAFLETLPGVEEVRAIIRWETPVMLLVVLNTAGLTAATIYLNESTVCVSVLLKIRCKRLSKTKTPSMPRILWRKWRII